VTDDTSVRRLLDAVAENRVVAGKPGEGFQGLGFRGVDVEILGDNDEYPARLPRRFVLAGWLLDLLVDGADWEKVLADLWSRQRITKNHQKGPRWSSARNEIGNVSQVRNA
jgi:hypothetical protein